MSVITGSDIGLFYIRSVISALKIEMNGIRLRKAMGPIARKILAMHGLKAGRSKSDLHYALRALHMAIENGIVPCMINTTGEAMAIEGAPTDSPVRLNTAGDIPGVKASDLEGIPGARGNDEARMVRLRGAE